MTLLFPNYYSNIEINYENLFILIEFLVVWRYRDLFPFSLVLFSILCLMALLLDFSSVLSWLLLSSFLSKLFQFCSTYFISGAIKIRFSKFDIKYFYFKFDFVLAFGVCKTMSLLDFEYIENLLAFVFLFSSSFNGVFKLLMVSIKQQHQIFIKIKLITMVFNNLLCFA